MSSPCVAKYFLCSLVPFFIPHSLTRRREARRKIKKVSNGFLLISISNGCQIETYTHTLRVSPCLSSGLFVSLLYATFTSCELDRVAIGNGGRVEVGEGEWSDLSVPP